MGALGSVSIRPEKIRILAATDAVPGGLHSARGTIRDVVYLGTFTRYLIELAGGGDVIVMSQNLDAQTFVRGQQVTLAWSPEHVRAIE